MIDAVVVGAGPNGLAAALTLAEAGRSVLVLEGHERIGGGSRTAELTLPGFHHDVCSAIHPLAAVSPFFAFAGLQEHGLELLHAPHPLAHPLGGDRGAVLHRDLDAAIAELGVDGRRWDQLVGWAARNWDAVGEVALSPVVRVPKHPLALMGFGLRGFPPTTWAAKAFKTDEARALLAGCAAHSFLPLSRPLTTAMGIMLLASAHVAGWPVPRGGSQAIVDAMASKLRSLGGTIETGRMVRSLADLPPAKAVLFDVTPRQLLAICGDELPASNRRRFERFRYGPGVFKVDFALSGPVPWTYEPARGAATVHLGGTIDEVAAGEAAVVAGRHPDRPFVLVGQQSLADPGRAPEGQHTLWAYCHVPHGSTRDMTDAIEAQIERFAPGFRDLVLAKATIDSVQYEAYNPSFVGGDIAGGSHGGLQLLLRPGLTARPYGTGNPRYFICSASTPPGGGVHGMCGLHAANHALRTTLR